MAKDTEDKVSPDGNGVDAALKEQLKAIEREETPEGLLTLARELQHLLRTNGQ